MQLTQLNSVQPISAKALVDMSYKRACFFFSISLLTVVHILHSKIPSPGKLVKTRHIWRHDLQTEATKSRRWELIGDSCSCCERVDNSTSSWVELRRRRYRYFADATQLKSTSSGVELSCVAINGPLVTLHSSLVSFVCGKGRRSVYDKKPKRYAEDNSQQNRFNCTQ